MPKSLKQGFETFLTLLAPHASERTKEERHRESVESCLKNSLGCREFFEAGSFGNGTDIHSFSGSDYFGVLPANRLQEDSSSTLRLVKQAFRETFLAIEGVDVRSGAVEIPLGSRASEAMNVIPCHFQGLIETPHGNLPWYNIPDGVSGWMRSSPKAHNAYVKNIDSKVRNNLKPLIRLVKAWKYYNRVPISSFYLELRITRFAEKEKAIIYDYDLKDVMRLLLDMGLASIQDPMGVSGYVAPCDSYAHKAESISKIQAGLSRATKAVAERDKDLDRCFHWWKLFFNNEFPAR